MEHVGHIADLDTALNASHYPGTDSTLKSYGLDALECVCEYSMECRGVRKERVLQDFLPVK